MYIRKFQKIGTITIPKGITSIDITDPCYDKDTWCRIKTKIIPGKYNAWIWMKGGRIFKTALIKAKIDINKETVYQKEIGFIGVDAGLAGYFVDKPDYNDKQWQEICDWIYQGDAVAWYHSSQAPMNCIGFFTRTGYGDGEYSVFEITASTGELIGYALEF